MPRVKPFEEFPDHYENWFEENQAIYESELQALRTLLPKGKQVVEIGVGSGRFAAPLDIRTGVEPSAQMRKLARQRGIDAREGVAENLPLNDSQFDFALMVTTICFLDDIEKAFREVQRILKPAGEFIIGFIDRESDVGQTYQQYKNESAFYSIATFYSVDEIISYLKKTGFRDFEFVQTIFRNLPEIKEPEPVKTGYGEGSFVGINAKA
ncbi:MAG: class I SAM-dependent methyltransferase [Bacteroidales bacterium]|nr:class I SAM-dependent methyltransferase [Bacteroidales bacterium]